MESLVKNSISAFYSLRGKFFKQTSLLSLNKSTPVEVRMRVEVVYFVFFCKLILDYQTCLEQIF